MEPWVFEQFLYAALTGDSALVALVGDRIYLHPAPSGIADPFVTYQPFLPGDDVIAAGARQVFTRDMTYLVVATTEGGSVATIAPVAAQIMAALSGKSVTGADGRIYGCRRKQPFRRTETDQDITYQHLGGMYAASVQQTA